MVVVSRSSLVALWRRLPSVAKVVFVLGCLLALVQTTRATLFAAFPDRPVHAVFPFDPFQHHHSCFTAYYEAARLAREVPNIYGERSYLRTGDDGGVPWQTTGDRRRTIGPFNVDQYEYPPPFLLLPRLLIATGADFQPARLIWFVLQATMVMGALLLLAWHLGGEWGARFGLVAPFIYLSPPVQITLQLGNFQVGAIALALIGMVAIAREREPLGAALLSFAILSKLFPGALLLVLAAQRRWRALLLTLAGAVLWTGLTLAIFGAAPFDAFFGHHLPRLASGEAFGQMRMFFPAAINQSVHGLPMKLSLFGIGSGSNALGSLLAWIFTVLVCAVAVWLGRRSSEPRRQPLLWALVLGLGTYRSPFLPQEYAAIGPLLVLCLLAVTAPLAGRRLLTFVVAFVLLLFQCPWGLSSDPIVAALINTVPQLVAVAVFVAAIRSLRTAVAP
jgi:alpha-1,2-mannosyltransferase